MAENVEAKIATEFTGIEKRVATLPARITSEAQNEAVCRFMGEVKSALKLVKAHYEPMRATTHAAWKAVCDEMGKYADPLKEIDDRCRKMVGEWQTSERDRLAREQAAAEEAARKAAEAKRQADTQMLAAAGFDADAVVVTETPVEAVAIAPPPPPKVAGVAMVEEWTWEVTDLAAVRRECLIVNEKMLDYKAKSEKGAAQEPGIRFFSRLVTRNRG